AGALIAAVEAAFRLSERLQHAHQVIGPDADAGIANRQLAAAVLDDPPAHVDRAARKREFHRIREQIDDDLLHLPLIAEEEEIRALGIEVEDDIGELRALRNDADAGGDQHLRIERLFVELALACLDAGEIKDVVDDREQMLGAAVDVARIFDV